MHGVGESRKQTTQLHCRCGKARLVVEGAPIASVECCCRSCREAGERMQNLNGAAAILTPFGATSFVMYRKDRVRFVAGIDQLQAFRLSSNASTRRVLAACCNTPVFLEFKGGHWLSLYGELWLNDDRPPLQLRTMTSDLPTGVTLPDDVPNASKQTIGFFAKLLGAWFAMGFRCPQMPAAGDMDV